MSRLFVYLSLLAMLAAPSMAQQQDDVAGESPDAAVSAPDAGDDATDEQEDVDDSDLDVQVYEDDDDDFVPTEEIPSDEPIPFPSNI